VSPTDPRTPAPAQLHEPEGDPLATGVAGPRAIRGAGLRVGGYGVGVLLSVGSAALLFRHLGVEDGGRYVTVLALVALAGGLTDAGLTSIALRELSSGDGGDTRPFLRTLLGVRLVLSVLAVLGAMAFAALAGYDVTLLAGTLLAGVGFVLQMIQATLAAGLMANLRLGWVTLAELVRQVAVVAAIVVLVLAGASLLPFLGASIAGGVAALALTAWLVRGQVPLRPALDRARARRLLAETLPFAVATAVGALYFRAAVIIVSLVAGETETGYFGVSFRVVEVLVVVPQLLVGAVFPVFARAAAGDRERLEYAVSRTVHACLVAGVGLAVVLSTGAPFVIDVVADERFEPAEDVLALQSVALAASFVGAVWGSALLGLRLHREVLGASLVALALSIALTVVLARAEGAVGGAVATVVGEAVLAAALGIALARAGAATGLRVGLLARVLLAAAPAVALLAVGLPSLVRAVLAALLYTGALVALRALPEELLDELRRAARRRSARR